MTGRAQDRMPPIPVHELTGAQAAAAAEFEAARNTEVFGPFVPLLRSPELMVRASALGDYLRFRSSLAPRQSEFVILMTARLWTQQYEWHVHRPIAIAAGVDVDVVDAIAEGRRPRLLSEEQEILYDFCVELHRQGSVSDATYDRAVSRFGEQGVIDTVGLCGYYSFLAMVLNVARTPLPPDHRATLVPFPR
jgi:4-carboxymuconolactone decarboxylase